MCLVGEGRDIEEVARKLNRALKNFNFLLNNRLHLNLSIDKCKVCLFNFKGSCGPDLFRMGGQVLEIVKEYKYLGVIIDEGLNGKRHLEYIRTKTTSLLKVMRVAANIKWGSHPFIMLLIYKGLIRSNLDWGFVLFQDCSNTETNKLNSIQHNAIRIALGLLRTTPTNIILGLANEAHLKVRREMLINRMAAKIRAWTLHPVNSIWSNLPIPSRIPLCGQFCLFRVLAFIDRISGDAADLYVFRTFGTKKFNFMARIIDMRKHVDVDFGLRMLADGEPNVLFSDAMRDRFGGRRIFYTDGSRSENGVGYGVWTEEEEQPNILHKINHINSIFYAEAMAILCCLKEIVKFKQIMTNGAVICSDSRSVLRGLCAMPRQGRYPVDVLFAIRELLYYIMFKLNVPVDLVWIPGHRGILGNEKADELAKRSVLMQHIDNNNVYFYQYYNKVKDKFLKEKDRLLKYEGTLKGKFFFERSYPFMSLWFKDYDLPRQTICIVNRVLSNHTRCRAHLRRMKIVQEDVCDCGDGVQDVNHLLFHCVNSATGREDLINDIIKLNPHTEINIENIVASRCIRTLLVVARFIAQEKLNI